jgi:hypothetical protein
MNKIAALCSYLINLNLFAAEQMDSFVDDMEVIPSGRKTTVSGQIVVFETDYNAVFFIERYQHKDKPVTILLAHISAWLRSNDMERLDFNFPINVEILDDYTADLEIKISFREQTTATEHSNGTLMFNQVRYKLDA